MSDFLTRIEFSNVVNCSSGSRSAVRSATGLWRSPGEVSWSKTPEKCWSFYIWRTNKWLKIGETLQANLFWMQVQRQYALKQNFMKTVSESSIRRLDSLSFGYKITWINPCLLIHNLSREVRSQKIIYMFN